MIEFIFNIIACIIGYCMGNFIYELYKAYKLKKSIFKSNYFKDTDFDFFNDNNDKSITDIKIEDIKEE